MFTEFPQTGIWSRSIHLKRTPGEIVMIYNYARFKKKIIATAIAVGGVVVVNNNKRVNAEMN